MVDVLPVVVLTKQSKLGKYNLAFSAALDNILSIQGLGFSTVYACLNLLPQFVEPDFS